MFDTEVNGTPCTCNVLEYHAGASLLIRGTGFGDCEPPEPEEFEFELLDSEGNEITALMDGVSSSDMERLMNEYKAFKDTYY